MKSTAKTNNKSALVLWDLYGKDLKDIPFEEAVKRLDDGYPRHVICREIISFNQDAVSLLNDFEDMVFLDNNLLGIILDEQMNGANYMFISPEVGEPVAGFHIESFTDKIIKKTQQYLNQLNSTSQKVIVHIDVLLGSA